ncbi:hypothetical protein ONZ45_g11824 [Pleurotus djamor]|nr:hypothetical protein ONZ45_g11824 [Pleurotus djamor]
MISLKDLLAFILILALNINLPLIKSTYPPIMQTLPLNSKLSGTLAHGAVITGPTEADGGIVHTEPRAQYQRPRSNSELAKDEAEVELDGDGGENQNSEQGISDTESQSRKEGDVAGELDQQTGVEQASEHETRASSNVSLRDGANHDDQSEGIFDADENKLEEPMPLPPTIHDPVCAGSCSKPSVVSSDHHRGADAGSQADCDQVRGQFPTSTNRDGDDDRPLEKGISDTESQSRKEGDVAGELDQQTGVEQASEHETRASSNVSLRDGANHDDQSEGIFDADENKLEEPMPLLPTIHDPVCAGSCSKPSVVSSDHHRGADAGSQADCDQVRGQFPVPPFPSKHRLDSSHIARIPTPGPAHPLATHDDPEPSSNSMQRHQLRQMADIFATLDASMLTEFMKFLSDKQASQSAGSRPTTHAPALTQSISVGSLSPPRGSLEQGLHHWWPDEAELASCVRASVIAKREIIKDRLLLRSSKVGLAFPPGQLPWHTLPFSLYENDCQMINLPDEVPFPGMESFKSAARGISSFPAQICTPWIQVLPKDTSLGATFRKVSDAESPLLRSGQIPILISAPPHPLSQYKRGKQLYMSNTRMWMDREGPPRSPFAQQDNFGVYKKPYRVDHEVEGLLSLQGPPKGVTHELGRAAKIRRLINQDVKSRKRTTKSTYFKRSASEEEDDEVGFEVERKATTSVPRRSSRLHRSTTLGPPPRKLSKALRRVTVSEEEADSDVDEARIRQKRSRSSGRSRLSSRKRQKVSLSSSDEDDDEEVDSDVDRQKRSRSSGHKERTQLRSQPLQTLEYNYMEIYGLRTYTSRLPPIQTEEEMTEDTHMSGDVHVGVGVGNVGHHHNPTPSMANLRNTIERYSKETYEKIGQVEKNAEELGTSVTAIGQDMKDVKSHQSTLARHVGDIEHRVGDTMKTMHEELKADLLRFVSEEISSSMNSHNDTIQTNFDEVRNRMDVIEGRITGVEQGEPVGEKEEAVLISQEETSLRTLADEYLMTDGIDLAKRLGKVEEKLEQVDDINVTGFGELRDRVQNVEKCVGEVEKKVSTDATAERERISKVETELMTLVDETRDVNSARRLEAVEGKLEQVGKSTETMQEQVSRNTVAVKDLRGMIMQARSVPDAASLEEEHKRQTQQDGIRAGSGEGGANESSNEDIPEPDYGVGSEGFVSDNLVSHEGKDVIISEIETTSSIEVNERQTPRDTYPRHGEGSDPKSINEESHEPEFVVGPISFFSDPCGASDKTVPGGFQFDETQPHDHDAARRAQKFTVRSLLSCIIIFAVSVTCLMCALWVYPLVYIRGIRLHYEENGAAMPRHVQNNVASSVLAQFIDLGDIVSRGIQREGLRRLEYIPIQMYSAER